MGSGRFSPRSIRAGQLADFLKHLSAHGARSTSLKDASASVSGAVYEASDSTIHLGAKPCVTKLLRNIRLHEPPAGRKAQRSSVGDVVRLLHEAFLFGPDDALGDGHLKEKSVLCLIVDTAARPSDITRLYRILSGRNRQFEFFTENGADGMRLRYFWSKEVQPHSSQANSTNVWFSSWVTVWCTTPQSICSHCVVRNLLRRTTNDDAFASVYVKQLDEWVQPLIWARLRAGKFQPSSKDHVSQLVARGLLACGLPDMKCQDIRGASTSKIVQCAPSLRSEALKLGRWTTDKPFNKHYSAPIERVPPFGPEDESSCQHVLRWGFNPPLPGSLSLESYCNPPSFWIGRRCSKGKVTAFEDGVYSVSPGNGKPSLDLYHWELMAALPRNATYDV